MQPAAKAIKRSPSTNTTDITDIPPAQPSPQFAINNMALSGQSLDPFGSTDYNNADFDTSMFQSQPLSDFLATPETAGQLVRRPTNQQLTTRAQLDKPSEWPSPLQPTGRSWEELSEEEELARRAAAAKKDAQSKRKQIPPFVLKLWSFLDESKNTDLIRWTEDGTAFTVLDEDEFARTLIPELFKHNNYASFVRQLNMYGFHKKVGLNANSMKAAEKKTKDPNVYWHEYFRENREDLLWLIQKPQSKSTAQKRKRGQDGKDEDSEDEKRMSLDQATLARIKGDDSDLVVLPKTEVVALRQEVQKLQRQQSVISQMIGQLKDQNSQFYRQASEFQSLHERHENSINAILTFLATFYNRSLEAGIDLTNMFGNNNTTPQQPQGAVVDMDGNDYQSVNTNQQLQRYRKPQLLLNSSPARDDLLRPGRVSTQPPSTRPSATPPQSTSKRTSLDAPSIHSIPSTNASPQLRDDADSPAPLETGHEMMSVINAANASTPSTTSSPHFDFSNALHHAQSANGANPLTPQQRTSMLNLIQAQQAGTSSSGVNNALTGPAPPMPDLAAYARNQEQLEMLARLQKEQDSKVQDLAGRLQPLSPNGSIPGLSPSGGGGAYDRASLLGHEPNPLDDDFDFDRYLREQAGGDPNTAADDALGDFDFGLGSAGTSRDASGAGGNDGDIFGDVVDFSPGPLGASGPAQEGLAADGGQAGPAAGTVESVASSDEGRS